METLVASFFLGLASAASPCLLPLYPAFLALLATRRGDPSRIGTGLLGLAVILGVVTALIAVGRGRDRDLDLTRVACCPGSFRSRPSSLSSSG